jgi:thiamine-monophosphate kinase
VVAVAGPLGRSAAGLALLTAGITAGPELAGPLAALVTAHLRPAPPYDAGPEAARLGATAMIDVSDGLLADVGHIAEASGVAVDIESRLLADGAAALQDAAGRLATSPAGRTGSPASAPPVPLSWVLTGGEDHSLVAVFPPGTVLPARWRRIGEVRAGKGVTVDGQSRPGPGGWQHFQA